MVILIVTKEEFKIALRKTIGARGMDESEIDRITEFVMGLFGFNAYGIDNMLSSSDRDVFYMLEEAKLLSTLRDEVTLAKGKVWRIHYWMLDEDVIHALAKKVEPKAVKEAEHNVYSDLSEEDWRR